MIVEVEPNICNTGCCSEGASLFSGSRLTTLVTIIGGSFVFFKKTSGLDESMVAYKTVTTLFRQLEKQR